MKLYNSLTKKLEDFVPQNIEEVSVYSCGPTVYSPVTIGNFRTFTLTDLLYRYLLFKGYKVRFIMNLTDVGHLTGDNLGNADEGEDRVEKSAEKEGKTAKEITDYYIDLFFKDSQSLNFLKPTKFTRATEYISDQINLVKELEKRGYTYVIRDGVYFDTSKFKDYGKLSGMTTEAILEGARIEPNLQKRNPSDFALWKFSPEDTKRLQEWDSPWGKGFPGWHIECSAMAMRELGETIDIHLGGEDLKMIHHQNEIAQSECATNRQFVKYWLHGSFLQVDGKRMGKSMGNAYTITDIREKGFDPLSLRMFYLSAHYRSSLNFTWEALQATQNSLKHLYEIIGGYHEEDNAEVSDKFIKRFNEKIDTDLNFPEALAVLWDMLKSSIPESSKVATALKMNEVLGLQIDENIGYFVTQDITDLAKMRFEYRKAGIWDKADMIRRELSSKGYVVEDNPDGTYKVKRKLR